MGRAAWAVVVHISWTPQLETLCLLITNLRKGNTWLAIPREQFSQPYNNKDISYEPGFVLLELRRMKLVTLPSALAATRR
jgi:hypothetical protein